MGNNNKTKKTNSANSMYSEKKSNGLLKKIIVIIVCLAVVLVFSIPFIGVSFADVENRNGIDIASTAAYIYAADMDQEIWSFQPDKRYNPASTTKMLTCLIAVENLALSDTVKITGEALSIPDNYPTLMKGEEFTVDELLHLALMESVNEAAKQLAISVSGSESKFAELMNEKAKEIGCTNSVFHNASGVTANGNHATAHDISMIANAAFKNATIREICSTTEYTVPKTNLADKRELENSNLLLTGGIYKFSGAELEIEKDESVICGKTGTSLAGKAMMSILAEVNGVETIVTILNSTQDERYNDLEKLLNYAREWISPYKAIDKGTPLEESAMVKCGAKNHVDGVVKEDAIINLPEGASPALIGFEYKYFEDLKAPIAEGQVVGQLTIYLADEVMRTMDIVAANEVKEGWFLSRFYISNLATIIAASVILLFIVFVITIASLRKKNKRLAKERREAKLREIARREMEHERDVRERDWPYL